MNVKLKEQKGKESVPCEDRLFKSLVSLQWFRGQEVYDCQSNPPFGEMSFFLIKNFEERRC